ncbi:hypothetical protein GCM10010236_14130 [Streptomyces eurythermus]|nr:hypothetical protein GCM10010236_14130 [Streptomyces eurythermus]
MRGAMPAAWAMSSARVARRPCRTKRAAAARAISIRVSAFRRSVRDTGAEAENGWWAGVWVVLMPGRLCPCGRICHPAVHPGVQVRGGPPFQYPGPLRDGPGRLLRGENPAGQKRPGPGARGG